MIVTHREGERGRDTGRGKSRLHALGARHGIRSRVSRIAPWALKAGAKPLRHPGIPRINFLKKDFIYLFMRDTETEAETQAEGEAAGSMHRERNVGFDPGSPESHPGPKAGAKPLRHPGIPT